VKVVILAGGLGTRLAEETVVRPKPMVEIGGRPILWHIMKHFSAYGHDDFVICCGYKSEIIKDFFANYVLRTADVTFDLRRGNVQLHASRAEKWRVTLIDTGADTMTGGRLRRVRDLLDETFLFTYGDAVSDVDLDALVAHHHRAQVAATVTAVQPPGRFGALSLDGSVVKAFVEKPEGDGAWINGGYFVLEPSVIGHVTGDETIWEQEPLQTLAANRQLGAYRHRGFWQPMDTLRDKQRLEELWTTGNPPWKVWHDGRDDHRDVVAPDDEVPTSSRAIP
jgi:glucose-1-phosphate cytidylyltransferase